ncbi:hypothetical protein MTO96_024358 [Rhipicephalus appendiculatus]
MMRRLRRQGRRWSGDDTSGTLSGAGTFGPSDRGFPTPRPCGAAHSSSNRGLALRTPNATPGLMERRPTTSPTTGFAVKLFFLRCTSVDHSHCRSPLTS